MKRVRCPACTYATLATAPICYKCGCQVRPACPWHVHGEAVYESPAEAVIRFLSGPNFRKAVDAPVTPRRIVERGFAYAEQDPDTFDAAELAKLRRWAADFLDRAETLFRVGPDEVWPHEQTGFRNGIEPKPQAPVRAAERLRRMVARHPELRDLPGDVVATHDRDTLRIGYSQPLNTVWVTLRGEDWHCIRSPEHAAELAAGFATRLRKRYDRCRPEAWRFATVFGGWRGETPDGRVFSLDPDVPLATPEVFFLDGAYRFVEDPVPAILHRETGAPVSLNDALASDRVRRAPSIGLFSGSSDTIDDRCSPRVWYRPPPRIDPPVSEPAAGETDFADDSPEGQLLAAFLRAFATPQPDLTPPLEEIIRRGAIWREALSLLRILAPPEAAAPSTYGSVLLLLAEILTEEVCPECGAVTRYCPCQPVPIAPPANDGDDPVLRLALALYRSLRSDDRSAAPPPFTTPGMPHAERILARARSLLHALGPDDPATYRMNYGDTLQVLRRVILREPVCWGCGRPALQCAYPKTWTRRKEGQPRGR